MLFDQFGREIRKPKTYGLVPMPAKEKAILPEVIGCDAVGFTVPMEEEEDEL